MSNSKFKVGQVVMWEQKISGKKYPFIVQDVLLQDGEWYYRFNRKNALHEPMIRALTAEEIGTTEEIEIR